MPNTAIVYEDVEVLEQDGLGLTCRIGRERVFVGRYVPINGTTVSRKGDRGTLALPRWFVEQQRLPLRLHLSDREVEEWAARAELHAAVVREYADGHPNSRAAQEALEQARAELNAALLVRGRRRRAEQDSGVQSPLSGAMTGDPAQLEDQLVLARLRAAVARSRVAQAPDDAAALDALRQANERVLRLQAAIARALRTAG